MANPDHLDRIKQGIDLWNRWREEFLEESPDLIEADLSGINLINANLSKAFLSEANLKGTYLLRANLSEANLNRTNLIESKLSGATLTKAYFIESDLSRANLSDADLSGAYLIRADLNGANLSKANLSGANLSCANLSKVNLCRANLSNADLRGANLCETHLIEADLHGANLSGADLSGVNLNKANLLRTNVSNCLIYGVSLWDVMTDDTTNQLNLTITPANEPVITADYLSIAQFLYLFLNNRQIQSVLDILARKLVLIVGHFSQERKAVLEMVREALRKHAYVPISVSFEKADSRSMGETLSTLARMTRFVVVDLTAPKIVLQAVTYIVSTTAIPVKPVVFSGTGNEPAPFLELRKQHPAILPLSTYKSPEHLATMFKRDVIVPAEAKAIELEGR